MSIHIFRNHLGPWRALCAAALVAAGASTAQAQTLPGKGVKVQPVQSSIAEETFQTLLVGRGLEKLGYDVQPIMQMKITHMLSTN